MLVTDSYRLDLSSLSLGSRVGIMRCAGGNLHYYLDGVDQGLACTDVPRGLHSVYSLSEACSSMQCLSFVQVTVTAIITSMTEQCTT